MSRLPFSISQKDVWTELRAWSNSCHLNIGGISRINGHIDIGIFEQALHNLIKENDALRLVPTLEGAQVLLDDFQIPLVHKDFSSSQSPLESAIEWQNNWMKEPFEVGERPPIRYALLSVSEDTHFCVIQSLHIAMDGWSVSKAEQKLGQHYTALLTGDNSVIETSRSYQDFIEDSLKYKSSKVFEKDKAYWESSFTELPEPVFDVRYNLSQTSGIAKANIEVCDINRQLINDLKQLAADNKCTLFHCFLGLLAIYINKSQHRNEFVIGLPSLNRGGGKYKSTLGMFVGVIPVKIMVEDDATPAEIINDISKSLKKAYRHAKYPLSEQFRRLKAIQQGRDRLFDVIFSFEDFVFEKQYGEATVGATNQTFSGFSRYPLAISVCDFVGETNAEMVLEGNEQYFSSAETQLIGQRLLFLGRQILTSYEQPISCLSINTKHEQQRLITSGLSLASNPQAVTPFFKIIEQKAELDPKAVASVWRGGALNYGELIHCAKQLTIILIENGVQSGDVVAFALERGVEVLITQLACSMIGAAFLPNDVEIPPNRLSVILQESHAKILLINEVNRGRFTEIDTHLISIGCEQLLVKKADLSSYSSAQINELDTAYILFTSGTTGKPKGVAVSHRALALRLSWVVEKWGISSADRSLQATQVNFDPALIELLVPLLKGGSVAFPPAGRLLPESLPQYMIEFGATMLAFVPSTLTRFMDGVKHPSDLNLRICCCGGEILSREVANRFVNLTNAVLFNVYGPTEACIFATSWQIKQSENHYKALPIGAPLADSQIFIVDKQNRLLPYGVVGEICIGGETLAQGYINQPEKTAVSFIESDLAEGQRLYKTGDLGWLDTDGILHFSGRDDRQIKLRGYRIELNEIENTLLNQPSVSSAAVKLVGSGSKAAIHTWLELKNRSDLELVRNKLSGLLPDYMLPSRYNVLDSMPHTANGKIDYDVLPNTGYISEHRSSRQPVGRLEIKILAIWQRTLKQPDLTVLDNFFEFGGDSLSAVVCLNEIEEMLGKRLSLYQLVENPTVASLADCLETALNLPKLLVSLGDTTRSVSMYIAASGNGDMMRFTALAKAMHGVCDLHMLQPPGNQIDIDIPQLASLYANKIKERGESEIYLAGFSVGGLAAAETARLLQKENIKVKELIIVDTILLRMPRVGLWMWKCLAAFLTKSGPRANRFFPKKLAGTLKDKGLYMQVKAMQEYELSQYHGDAILLKSSAYRYLQAWLLGRWRKIIKPKPLEFQIETSHSRFFEPGNVEKLAEILQQRITR